MTSEDEEPTRASAGERHERNKRARSATPPVSRHDSGEHVSSDLFRFMQTAYEDAKRESDFREKTAASVLKYLDRAKATAAGHAASSATSNYALDVERAKTSNALEKLVSIERDLIDQRRIASAAVETMRAEMEKGVAEAESKRVNDLQAAESKRVAEEKIAELHSSKVMLIPPI
jgi:leucyl-tRNA synthetase